LYKSRILSWEIVGSGVSLIFPKKAESEPLQTPGGGLGDESHCGYGEPGLPDASRSTTSISGAIDWGITFRVKNLKLMGDNPPSHRTREPTEAALYFVP